MSLKSLSAFVLLVLCMCCIEALGAPSLSSGKRKITSVSEMKGHGNPRLGKGQQRDTILLDDTFEQYEEYYKSKSRAKRSTGGKPVFHGNHTFDGDNNQYAQIHYSGEKSPVIIVMTYTRAGPTALPSNTHLYRSTDYGASFTDILSSLDQSDATPTLNDDFFVSPIDKNLVVFTHATSSKLYYSTDEGLNWNVRSLTPSTLNPRSLIWNDDNDRWALALDNYHNRLFVTRDLGATWSKLDEYVNTTSFQWGDASAGDEPSMVYYNTYDPSDNNRGDFTVHLYTQQFPYAAANRREFDPQLGKHDDFLLLGPYIFAQKTNELNEIQLYISYNRQPFQMTMIPSTEAHQNYIVDHIQEQQALVIVEHVSGQFNLYLSDITGVYFSLSLPDLVVTQNGIDLEQIEGVEKTLIANGFVRGTQTYVRTLLSLNNGGRWNIVSPPSSGDCSPPQCSLHFHMDSSDYARTGVYSQDSAPGIIIAHGNVGSQLSDNPDLYISRDGGVSWSLTLSDSWGITVVDHGGLLVAARDYHNITSNILMYSCDEGLNWSSFTFSDVNMIVFGVITEPGEHTTTVSLYGVKQGKGVWDVVTVNFSAIFPSTCTFDDYYSWHPWDGRIGDLECLLGSAVSIERRNMSHCCLIGEEYSRHIDVTACACTAEDFDCDYGYKRSSDDDLSSSCMRDSLFELPDPCADGSTDTYMRSQGYRKIPGDGCTGGVSGDYSAVSTCCAVSSSNTVPVALGIMLMIAVVAAVVLGAIAIMFFCKHSAMRRSYLTAAVGPTSSSSTRRVQFRSSSPTSQPLVSPQNDRDVDDDDDDPLAL